MEASQVIATIMLGGLMGLFGQGIRAIRGLKTMVDDAAASGNDLFSAARLLISLVIGFLAGIAATLILGVKFVHENAGDAHVLLGIAACGYAGTDFIEGFISKYLPAGRPKPEGNKADDDKKADPAALKNSLAVLTGKVDGLAQVVAKPPDGRKPIARSQINAWFLRVLHAGPNVQDTDRISKYRYGEDVNLDLANECNAAPAFKADGLNLQKADVEGLQTVKDFTDCIAAWYGRHNCNVTGQAGSP
jgi:hypothetical protein